MNKPTVKTLFAVALCAAFATSCGSSSSKERTLELSGGVTLDVIKTPDGLWFGKTEVTQAQWEAVMGENPSKNKAPDNPVEMVSWNGCQEFLGKLNELPGVKKSGLTFRLPTEAEWERACRAGATGDFCLLADGTEVTTDTLGQVAWFSGNSDEKTHPVGQKQPNAFGLYDMNGNVAEWTSSANGSHRVLRGGSCFHLAKYCMSSYRDGDSSSYRNYFLGFRLCAEVEGRHAAKPAAVKAREERKSAESKSVSISDAVAIDLRSVPGPLWFGKTEVTQAQWEVVMGNNPSDVKNPSNPVEMVSWDGCQEFLKKLNALPVVKKSGLTFRLPTEEEWERACLAGATGDYCRLADGTGITESMLGQVAWFRDNSDDKTHPVGQKQPNAFGLYDMHGNVWEWTSTADGDSRVCRGGGFFNVAGYCTAGYRGSEDPDFLLRHLGFRLCAEAAAK